MGRIHGGGLQFCRANSLLKRIVVSGRSAERKAGTICRIHLSVEGVKDFKINFQMFLFFSEVFLPMTPPSCVPAAGGLYPPWRWLCTFTLCALPKPLWSLFNLPLKLGVFCQPNSVFTEALHLCCVFAISKVLLQRFSRVGLLGFFRFAKADEAPQLQRDARTRPRRDSSGVLESDAGCLPTQHPASARKPVWVPHGAVRFST